MLDKKVIEKLAVLLEKIKQENILIVVEGFKDKKSLISLGFSHKRIFTLYKKPLFRVVEDVVKTEKRVVILTDLDSEGKKLYSKLKRDLSERGIYIDNKLRNFLFKYTKLRQVEGLKNYIDRNNQL